MAKVAFSQYFNAPIAQVFERITTHNILEGILPFVTVDVLKNSDGTDGVNSVRSLGVSVIKPFKEKVTVFEPPYKQEYTIVGLVSKVIKHHYGVLSFSEQGEHNEHTLLVWTIDLTVTPSFLSGLILNHVKKSIQQVLQKEAKQMR